MDFCWTECTLNFQKIRADGFLLDRVYLEFSENFRPMDFCWTECTLKFQKISDRWIFVGQSVP